MAPSRLGVLCYHRVGPPISDPWDLVVTPTRFDEQVGLLARTAQLVSVRAAMREPRSRRVRGERRYAITFDDGYADTLRCALPVLERRNAPATVFVAGGFLDLPSFWWDRIAELTLMSGIPVEAVAAAYRAVDPACGDWSPTTHSQLHDELYAHLAPRGRARIDEVLDDVASRLGLDRGPDAPRPLTSDELVELAAHPLIEIGAHTSDHPDLRTLDEAERRRQIGDGERQLDRLLGPRRRSFAYPHGATDRATARSVRRMGFREAFTTDSRLVSPFDSRFLIPRLHATDLAPDAFERWLQQV